MLSQRDRILPPYTRKVTDLRHRLVKAAVITATLAFAIVMGFWIALFSTLVVPIFVAIIGVLLLAAMWMADDLEPDLSRIGAFLYLSFIALLIGWPNYLAVDVPGLPWITPTRIVLALMAGVFLLQASQSRITRDLITDAISGMKPAYIGYAVFIFFMFATLLVAKKSGDGLSFVVQQLILWNLPLLVGLWLFNDQRLAPKMLVVVAVPLSIVMVLTYFESRIHLPIWIPHIPSFLQVDGPQMQAFLSTQFRYDGTYRAKGIFGIHLYYSQLLLIVLPFVLHRALEATSPARRGLAIAFLGLTIFTILLNNTRTVMTGQLVVFAGMLGIFALRHYLHTRSRLDMTGPIVALSIPAAIVVMAALVASSTRLRNMTLGGKANVGSDDVRAGQWQKAFDALLSNPLGHGTGDSGPLTGRLANGIWIVDSQWINFLVDYGIIGAGGLMVFLAFVAITGVLIYLQRADRSADLCGPAAVAIGSIMMTMITISYVGNLPLLMILVAMITATRHRLAQAGKLASPREVLQRAIDKPLPVPA
jgi:hypothetical protein